MASFNYEALRDGTVIPLINQFGKAATLLAPGTPTGPDYDPQPGPPVEQPVEVVSTNIEESDTIGTKVQMTDEAYLVSPKGVTVDPQLVDRIEVDGQTLAVIRIKELKPGPTTMLWKVFARK